MQGNGETVGSVICALHVRFRARFCEVSVEGEVLISSIWMPHKDPAGVGMKGRGS